MVIPLVIAAAAQIEAAAPPLPAEELPQVFMSACLDGMAKLSAGQAFPVRFDELPAALQSRLGKPAGGKIWKLNSAGSSFLYVLDYERGPGVHPKLCGLASNEMRLNPAADALERRMTGSVTSNKLRGSEWWRPEDGYVAAATTAGRFNVLQITWLNDVTRRAALNEMRVLGDIPPRSTNQIPDYK
jgi:hypothetical protein